MGTATKIGLTALVTIVAIPGLIIEPGPISEVIWAGLVAAIWGLEY